MDEIPQITPALLKHLKARYPDRSPDPAAKDRDIWIDVGAVKVVRHLEELYFVQQEEEEAARRDPNHQPR